MLFKQKKSYSKDIQCLINLIYKLYVLFEIVLKLYQNYLIILFYLKIIIINYALVYVNTINAYNNI